MKQCVRLSRALSLALSLSLLYENQIRLSMVLIPSFYINSSFHVIFHVLAQLIHCPLLGGLSPQPYTLNPKPQPPVAMAAIAQLNLLPSRWYTA